MTPADIGPSTAPADAAACDCDGSTGPSRRAVLGGVLGLGTLGATAGLLGPLSATQLAFGAPGYDGDVLVVVSLRGGFDGLSAVVPAGDPGYAAARPTIGIPTGVLHPLDPMFGLHPALGPLLPLWQAGTLAAVHAVGQSDPTRSHFQAMEEMERAAPGSSLRTGWIDRTLGVTGSGTPFAGTSVGSATTPTSMSGPAPVTAMSSLSSFTLSGASNATESARWRTALRGLHHGSRHDIRAPATTTLAALATAGSMAAGPPANGAAYPGNDLGTALRDVARLVKAGVGLRVAAVDCGNWDMHVGMGASDRGWMHDNLAKLAAALTAFATDLGDQLSGVTLVTLSEFGRRVGENGSGGVDHGHGNAVLVMGGGIRGGQVYGRWPGLAAGRLDSGDLAAATDYRTVLAEILEKRCAVSTGSVFPKLPAGRLGLAAPRS